MRRTLRFGFETISGFRHEWESLNAAAIKRLTPLLADIEAIERDSISDIVAELTSANIPRITQLIRQVKNGRKDRFSAMTLSESADEKETSRAEWFLVAPATFFDIEESSSGLYAAKADRRRGSQQLREYSGEIFFSEKAKNFIQKQGLEGLEFVWVKDSGKFSASQWYHAFAVPPLGRGIDHPWFDPQKYGKSPDPYSDLQPADPFWRRGISYFSCDQLRKKIDAEAALAELLAAIREDVSFSNSEHSPIIDAARFVLREYLPKADFAYTWSQPISDEWYRDGTYLVCASRRARDLLVDSRLATSKDFQAIITLDAPPPGTEVLDGSAAPLPGPRFGGKQLEKLRAQEKAAYTKHQAKPKPQKPTDFKPPFAMLKKRAKKEKWPKGASAEAIESAAAQLKLAIPARWADVLSVADGFETEETAIGDGEALTVASTAKLPEVYESALKFARGTQKDFPRSMLAIAVTDLGNRIFLDTASQTKEGDCPALFFDHEIGEVSNTWPSLASFLTELLDSPDEE